MINQYEERYMIVYTYLSFNTIRNYIREIFSKFFFNINHSKVKNKRN